MKKKFKKEVCNCGCNKEFTKWLNPPNELPTYKVNNYSNSEEKYPLEIIRLSDNVKFRLGDTLLLVSANNKVKCKVKLYNIQVVEKGFMKGFLQLHTYSLYSSGTITIRNEFVYLNNADDCTNFMFTKNITK
jgi:hypothetical protein